MNKLNITCLLVLIFTGNFYFSGIAQTDKEILTELAADEQEAVNALVLYPEATRTAILNATLHPEALIKMQSIQQQTSTSFKNLMEDYSQDTQEMIWDLTRYPDLIPELIAKGKPSYLATEAVLKNYPEVIHPRAKQASADHFQLLVEVDKLNRSAKSAFDTLLSDYSPQTQQSLQQLIELPEVLTILTDNIRLSVLVGDIYKKDPEWLLHKVDSLNLEVARQNAVELEEWKESLENNPEAAAELKASSEAFADEYAYDDEEYYGYNSDDLYYDEPERIYVRDYHSYHYPYWFGYPYWYEYPRWRHYPHWYDWGFYYGLQRTIIVVGLPSYHFTHWYFYYPYHHTYWPNLSSHFVNHYYGHRNGTSSVTSGVSTWRKQHNEVITDEWLKDDGKLSDRFKEYGKFETERLQYNEKNPKKPVSQKEYIAKNSKRYPTLSNSVKGQDNIVRKDNETTVPLRPDKTKPEIRDSKTEKPDRKFPENPERTRTVPNVNRAEEFHKNTWDNSRIKRPPTKSPQVMPGTKRNPSTPIRTKPKTAPRSKNPRG